MAQIDAALEQQVLDIAQRQREAHIHQHHQPDHLGRRVEAPERAGRFGSRFARHPATASSRGHPLPRWSDNATLRPLYRGSTWTSSPKAMTR